MKTSERMKRHNENSNYEYIYRNYELLRIRVTPDRPACHQKHTIISAAQEKTNMPNVSDAMAKSVFTVTQVLHIKTSAQFPEGSS